jgi:hypothetical protein
VELAYTFFTDGPDEALDPLILGLSSFVLIEISNSSSVTHFRTIATPVLLISIAIVALFIARKFLLEVRKETTAEAAKVPPSDTYLG